MSTSSNLLETMDLASWPMGLVQLLEESVLVVVELLVEMRKQLELQVVVGQYPTSAMSLATCPQFYFRLQPTESSQGPVVVVVAAMMLLTVDAAAWLQPVAVPPSHSVYAASQVVQAQACQ